MKISAYNRLLKTHVSTINIFGIILQLNEASSYHILPTSLPYQNQMYLEYGDCCQQAIISCGNDLARVSNKSFRADSLTCENFVPNIQIRGIVLSRNAPAEKCCHLIIAKDHNFHKLTYIGLTIIENV